MSPRVSLTYSTAMVLQALARGYHYGFDMLDVTGLPSGTVYPILRRLDRAALVVSSWEDAELAHDEQRPPRRYYELTPLGEDTLERALLRYRTVPDAVPRAPGGLDPALARRRR